MNLARLFSARTPHRLKGDNGVSKHTVKSDKQKEGPGLNVRLKPINNLKTKLNQDTPPNIGRFN